MKAVRSDPGSSGSTCLQQWVWIFTPFPLRAAAALFLFLAAFAPLVQAVPLDEEDEIDAALAEMSLDELMNIEVTSVSKKSEKLSKTSAAVFVITGEEIRRSGATNIADALRMVPGVQVARIDAGTWAVTARGFNGQFANKLLVLMDGRSVYSTVFSGTYWEVQDTMLEDIERIEVIRGPGASVWGANAVNGVINIITKNSRDTQGGLISAHAGNEEKAGGVLRYGGQIDENTWFRVYGKGILRDNSVEKHGGGSPDKWDLYSGGFRFDWELSERDSITFQGDHYDSHGGNTVTAMGIPYHLEMTGSNILGRWTRVFSDTSSASFQVYYDRTDFDIDDIFPQVHDTIDFDFQHRFGLISDHDIIWGLGYRAVRENVDSTFYLRMVNETRHDNLLSAFVQDDITLVEDLLRLTVGTKFEHNDYTGLEIQPTVRMLWTPHDQHTVWAALSRAVRTPSTFETYGMISYANMFGNKDFKSEELVACELGYRVLPVERLSLDVATFFNTYDNLRSFDTVPAPPFPLIGNNRMDARTWGAELAAEWKMLDWWRFRSAYTFMQVQLHPDTDSMDFVTEEREEGGSPHNQISFSSSMDLSNNVELDCGIRYVDRIPGIDVGNYTGFDLRLGWSPIEDLDIALVGHDLLRRRHTQFTPDFQIGPVSEIERSVYVQVTWRF